MKIEEEKCYCCFNCPIDKRNLKSFNKDQLNMYKEFTGNQVESDGAKICVSCIESLINSLAFLKCCITTRSKFQFNISEIRSEDIIIAQDEQISQDLPDEVQFEDDDDIPISIIKEQLFEVVEIKSPPKTQKSKKSGDKRYACDFQDCGMKFAQANALKCHLRTHTKSRPYICSYCSKSFSQNTTLKTHIVAKHTGKSVECTFEGCTRKFSRNSFLKLHIKRDHDLKRDYKCGECTKTYKQKSHLIRHVEATHMKVRHSCPLCEKSFTKAWTLKLHQFSHTKPENFPYKCLICKINFQRRDKMLKHMSKEHPNEKISLDPVEISQLKVNE